MEGGVTIGTPVIVQTPAVISSRVLTKSLIGFPPVPVIVIANNPHVPTLNCTVKLHGTAIKLVSETNLSSNTAGEFGISTKKSLPSILTIAAPSLPELATTLILLAS